MSNWRFGIVVVVLNGKPPLWERYCVLPKIVRSSKLTTFMQKKSSLLRCFGYREKMYERKEK